MPLPPANPSPLGEAALVPSPWGAHLRADQLNVHAGARTTKTHRRLNGSQINTSRVPSFLADTDQCKIQIIQQHRPRQSRARFSGLAPLQNTHKSLLPPVSYTLRDPYLHLHLIICPFYRPALGGIQVSPKLCPQPHHLLSQLGTGGVTHLHLPS